MNSRDRVLTAINLGIPDKVPWMELSVDPYIGSKLLNRKQIRMYNDLPILDDFEEFWGFIGWEYCNPVEICRILDLDAWGFFFVPTYYAKKKIIDTPTGPRTFLIDGLIKNRNDLNKIKLPNLKDNSIFEVVNNYIRKYKKDYAVFACTHLGIEEVIQNLSWKTFSYLLVDDFKLVEELLDIYCEWEMEAAKKLSELDFDFIWFADDIACKNSLMLNPNFFREILIPRFKKVIDSISKPWVFHTDGNFLEVIEDLLSLGVKGLHPIEPDAIDIFDFKKKYGARVCTIGNIDINKLTLGSEEEVYSEVRSKLKGLSHGGSYIMSSSNSIPSYCKVENIRKMHDAFLEFR